MSTTTPAAASSAPGLDVGRSYEVLQQRVYLPVLLDKLARDYGLHPQGEDLHHVLQIANTLRAAYNDKKASEVTLYAAGAQHLNQLLQPAAAPPANRTKAAADFAFNDPTLRTAATTLAVAMAQHQAAASAN